MPIPQSEASLSSTPVPSAGSIGELEAIVDRLVSEWRDARAAAGLSHGAPWSQIAEYLGVDRGSAQRLVRMGRLNQPSAADLEHLPGPRGWQRILEGLARQLGTDHGAYKRLVLACERFGETLALFGGSKAAALRQVATAPKTQSASVATSRGRMRWFESAASVMNYRVETRLNLRFIRPSLEDPTRLDIGIVHAFLGCTGERGALPFAVSRYATRDGVTPTNGAVDPGTEYRLLETATSSPPPTLLSTGDVERNTVFIEPGWPDRNGPLDVAILQVEKGAMNGRMDWDPPVLVLSTLTTHPAERLLMQTLLHPDVHEDTIGRLAAYRDLAVMGQTRHWFDRLPESAPLEVLDAERSGNLEFFPNYRAFVDEVDAKLGWDLTGYRGHQVVVDYPIPFARYSIEYERQPAE